MKSIQFFGSAGEVTGSSHLVTNHNGDSLLVDLGMFQGARDREALNFEPLSFNVSSLLAVCITHAHLDHCGRLPLLIKAGYTGKIYATEATRDIYLVSLMDSAKISKEDGWGDQAYTMEEVEQVLAQTEIVSYDKPFMVGPFQLTFYNAGHILGSASITVTDGQQTVAFSGDLGNSPQDLIQPTSYIPRATAVVMESTYGDENHPHEQVSQKLQEEINAVEESHGVLLIPAFSIERTQEILHLIDHLVTNQRIQATTPIYLDSPMATRVTEIFKKYPRLYNAELKEEKTPFDFPNLQVTISGKESKQIKEVAGPKVIIAGSGMMSGGRIMHHLANYIANPTTRILIVGYQAEDTLGREIQDGATNVTIDDTVFPVHATISELKSMSAHADQDKLIYWLSQIKGVEEVFLVHGDDDARVALAERITGDLGIKKVFLPHHEEVFKL